MGLGAGELALILVIAYVVVGPEDMVKLARTLARTLRQLRKLTVDLHEEAVGGINLPSVPIFVTGSERLISTRIPQDGKT